MVHLEFETGMDSQQVESTKARIDDIEHKTNLLIRCAVERDALKLQEIMSQISPKESYEFGVMAQLIVSKALDEPQYCQACVSLSSALRELLPALPSLDQRTKSESFMHAFLDIFQAQFEAILTPTPIANHGADLSSNPDQSRLQAVIQLARQLYGRKLLGRGAVIQIAQDLQVNGQEQHANELLWSTAIITEASNHEKPQLGTITEEIFESESANSTSRRPSCA